MEQGPVFRSRRLTRPSRLPSPGQLDSESSMSNSSRFKSRKAVACFLVMPDVGLLGSVIRFSAGKSIKGMPGASLTL